MRARLSLTAITLVMIGSVLTAVAENDAEADVLPAFLSIHEFKRVLENGKILNVLKSGHYDLEGDFLNDNGITNTYTINLRDPSCPFLVDALKEQGLEIDFQSEIDDSDRSFWLEGFIFYELPPILLITSHIVMLVMIIRIWKRLKE